MGNEVNEGLITGGDVLLQMHESHSRHKAGNTLATVLGIVGALIVIAILWWAFVRNHRGREEHNGHINKELGELCATTKCLKEEVKLLCGYERNDALKIAFMEGQESNEKHKHGFGCGCGCHGHKRKDDDKFKMITTFGTPTQTATFTESCGGC